MRNRMPALAAASALLLTLTACVPPAEIVVRVEPSHAQPVFASDEEALAAAVAVFEEYQEVAYDVDENGNPDYERLSQLLTNDWLANERAGIEKFASEGLRLAGSATVVGNVLQQWWEEPPGIANVIAYFCTDLSQARILDDSGNDVTPSDRDDLLPIEVSFVSSAADADFLMIAEVRPWNGDGLC